MATAWTWQWTWQRHGNDMATAWRRHGNDICSRLALASTQSITRSRSGAHLQGYCSSDNNNAAPFFGHVIAMSMLLPCWIVFVMPSVVGSEPFVLHARVPLYQQRAVLRAQGGCRPRQLSSMMETPCARSTTLKQSVALSLC